MKSMNNKHTCKDTEEPLYAYYLTMAAFLGKTKKINAFIIYAHVINSKTLNVLNFIKDVARLSYYEKRSNYNSSYTKNKKKNSNASHIVFQYSFADFQYIRVFVFLEKKFFCLQANSTLE